MAHQQQRESDMFWSQQHIQDESIMTEHDPQQDPNHTWSSWKPSVGMTGQYIQGEPQSAVDYPGQFLLQPSTEPWRSDEVSFEGGYRGYNTHMRASASTSWGGSQDHGYPQERMRSETEYYSNTRSYSGRVDMHALAGLCDDSSFKADFPIGDGSMSPVKGGGEGYPPLANADLTTVKDTPVGNSTMWEPTFNNQLAPITGAHVSREQQQMMASMNFNEAQPWSYPRMPNAGLMFHDHVERGYLGDSETSYSTVERSNTGSVSWNPQDYETSASSASCSGNAMGDSSITMQPPVWNPTGDLNGSVSSTGNRLYNPRLGLPRINLERSATPSYIPQMNTQSFGFDPQHLVPGMERARSSISSSGTDDSSLDIPLVEKSFCNRTGCVRAFTGVYRNGNLARHKRLYHRDSSPYLCKDDACAKGFKRQDARLKHYRKHHPHLAAKSPFKPRPQGTRRPQ